MSLAATIPAPIELFRTALLHGVRNVFDVATELATGPAAHALKATDDYPICRYDDASCLVMEQICAADTGRSRWCVKSAHTNVRDAEADMTDSDVLLILVD